LGQAVTNEDESLMRSLVAPIFLVAALADSPTPPGPGELVIALESALADAIAKAEPSVVSIAREKSENGETTTAVRGLHPVRTRMADESRIRGRVVPFAEDDQEDIQRLFSFDYGSGVVIGPDGLILTTCHTIKGASRLVVKAGGNQYFDAEVIAADPRSDLAVIVPQVQPGVPPPQLKPIALGDAAKLRKGSFLLALGSPFNAGRGANPSASWGILSNTSRRIEPNDSERQQPVGGRSLRHYPTLLQLDSKLNLGMSGGAVVNLKGELVGITTDAASPSGFDARAGYAIPIDPLIKRVIDTLREGKEFEYGFLGVSLDHHVTNRIASLDPQSPAGQGDLIRDDTIVAVNDLPVTDGDSLVLAVNAADVGKPVKLKVVREGQTLEKNVLVSKLAVSGEVIAINRPNLWRGLRVDFVSALAFGPSGESVLRAMALGGVGVAEVAPGSPAEAAGVKVGQVITRVNGKPVHTPAEFRKAVADLKGDVVLQTDPEQDPVKVPDK
jgi:serine protease Do